MEDNTKGVSAITLTLGGVPPKVRQLLEILQPYQQEYLKKLHDAAVFDPNPKVSEHDIVIRCLAVLDDEKKATDQGIVAVLYKSEWSLEEEADDC
jgi:hypothetical protein